MREDKREQISEYSQKIYDFLHNEHVDIDVLLSVALTLVYSVIKNEKMCEEHKEDLIKKVIDELRDKFKG